MIYDVLHPYNLSYTIHEIVDNINFQEELIMRLNSKLFGVSFALLLAITVSCDSTMSSDYNPPSDHTLEKNGIMHKTGLNKPLNGCTECHGTDLKGGTSNVSCYECHSKEW